MKSNASVRAVSGFRFAAVDAGIRKRAALDVALIVADRPVPTAAVFTTNRVQAAPVRVARDRLKKGRAQAVLVNAGCANACTGKPGTAATLKSTAAIAKALGIAPGLVLPASTGVIGQLLPAAKIVKNANALILDLSSSNVDAFSHAILTTDRGPKVARATVKLGKVTVSLLGIAKGAGMIHPNMATTLGFVVTDAKISAPVLRRALRSAADGSFNAVTVDGDTSTNDTLVAMASGDAGNVAIKAGDANFVRFEDALTEVLCSLAAQIVADGEGAEHTVGIEVTGARTKTNAMTVARTIATSNLVKTALYGKDPNWGRILAAAGRCGVKFDEADTEVRVGDVLIVKKGLAVGAAAEKKAHDVMTHESYTISLKIGRGKHEARYVTCDLGHEYVRINADYRS
ncbi:MAG: bifunctional glutamate N-acetyltransferase/amino-acid acetyltransferase ArgJ [Sandaracinaceae bacterium]|nr:bifunctional glutamate N-acetyltransferase/amino-acid acetyltransferase ArgJ [Sandaracinaceae bacterium]